MKEQTIDLLEKAYKKQEVSVNFDIPIGDDKIEAKLEIDDWDEIRRESRRLYNRYYLDYVEQGDDKRKINESLWLDYLKGFKKDEIRKREEKNKPRNLAEQLAGMDSNERLMIEMVVKFIKDRNTGRPLFGDTHTRERFKVILKKSLELRQLLMEKILELFEKRDQVEKQVKN